MFGTIAELNNTIYLKGGSEDLLEISDHWANVTPICYTLFEIWCVMTYEL